MDTRTRGRGHEWTQGYGDSRWGDIGRVVDMGTWTWERTDGGRVEGHRDTWTRGDTGGHTDMETHGHRWTQVWGRQVSGTQGHADTGTDAGRAAGTRVTVTVAR